MLKRGMAPTGDDIELNMTPMIDIVFQLIIFFMLTLKFKDIDRRIDSALPKDRGPVATTEFPEDLEKVKIKIFRRNMLEEEGEHYTHIRVDNVHRFSLPRGWLGFRKELDASGPDSARVKAYKSTVERVFAAVQKRRAEHVGDPAELKGEISAPPPKGGSVPHGDVMQMLDVFLRAGITDVMFEGKATPLNRRERAALAGS